MSRLYFKKRSAEIYRLRNQGKSFTEIGYQFAISRERVRQIYLAEERRKKHETN